jgi:hypothetical protein
MQRQRVTKLLKETSSFQTWRFATTVTKARHQTVTWSKQIQFAAGEGVLASSRQLRFDIPYRTSRSNG